MKSRILVLCILLLAGAATSFAYIINSGITGNCTWTLSDGGTLTISGEGGIEPEVEYVTTVTHGISIVILLQRS
jgi:hypothetical protein